MHKLTDWLRSAEATLDRWGMPGWIGAAVLSLIVLWPVGLAILGYMIWSGRMTFSSQKSGRRWGCRGARRGTGNSAFEEYREETIKRLEEEESAFSGFLDKLRRARERAEFDQFMSERAHSNRGSGSDTVEPA